MIYSSVWLEGNNIFLLKHCPLVSLSITKNTILLIMMYNTAKPLPSLMKISLRKGWRSHLLVSNHTEKCRFGGTETQTAELRCWKTSLPTELSCCSTSTVIWQRTESPTNVTLCLGNVGGNAAKNATSVLFVQQHQKLIYNMHNIHISLWRSSVRKPQDRLPRISPSKIS